MSRLVVDSFSNLEQLQELEATWDDLLARSGSDTVFLTFEWVTAWLRWVGRDTQPLVLVARDGAARIHGIAPLMVTTTAADDRPMRTVEFIGAPNSDYSDFIVAGEREPVLRAFLRHMLVRPRTWDRIWLRELPEGSPSLPVLRRLCRSPRFRGVLIPGELCPTLLLGGREAQIRQDLAHKNYSRKNLASSLRHVATFGPFSLRSCATLAEARAVLPALFDLHRRRWTGVTPSKFEDPAHEFFYRELLEWLWPAGHVAVDVMELAGRPIAAGFTFPYKRRWIGYTWVHDRDYGKLSPGSLLIQFMITEALDRGYLEFDFTRGAETYKQRFTNQVRQNTDLVVYGDSRDYLQVRLHHHVKRGRDQIARYPRVHRALQIAKRNVRRPGPS